MKTMKLKQILFAAAVVAMATACNHAIDDTTPAPAPKGVSVSLVASADTDETTRTALGATENGSYKYEDSMEQKIRQDINIGKNLKRLRLQNNLSQEKEKM